MIKKRETYLSRALTLERRVNMRENTFPWRRSKLSSRSLTLERQGDLRETICPGWKWKFSSRYLTLERRVIWERAHTQVENGNHRSRLWRSRDGVMWEHIDDPLVIANLLLDKINTILPHSPQSRRCWRIQTKREENENTENGDSVEGVEAAHWWRCGRLQSQCSRYFYRLLNATTRNRWQNKIKSPTRFFWPRLYILEIFGNFFSLKFS